MSITIRLSSSSLMAVATFSLASVATAAPAGGIGNEFVRSHPYTIAATNVRASALDVTEVRGAGMTTLLAWAETQLQIPIAAQSGLPWRGHIQPPDTGMDDWFRHLVTTATAQPGCETWIIYDEPSRLVMPLARDTAAWVRTTSPGHPVYPIALPSYAPASLLYGEQNHPNYTWNAYLDDFIAITQPDVLSYDHYPFLSDGTTRSNYFYDLMMIRAKALQAHIPYFAYLQSWAYTGWRLPSESDLRMQAYSYLAAGYSSLSYFTYDHNQQGGLLDASGNPTALYSVAANLNTEIEHLGRTLRLLTSTGVSYLPGRTTNGSVNPAPSGLSVWSQSSPGSTHITAAKVQTSLSIYRGPEKNGLIGFFQDDDGKRYFMVVNLSHGPNLAASQEKLAFTLTFDGTVDSLQELDGPTGATKTLQLKNHTLSLTIPGGTGRLFKFDDGPFVPALQVKSVKTENVTETSADVRFVFSEKAQGQVEYGTSTSYGNWSTKETSFNFSEHLQKLENLTPATTYHYRVHGWSQDGDEVVSGDQSFKTLGGSTGQDAGPQDSGQDSSSEGGAAGSSPGSDSGLGGTAGASIGTDSGLGGASDASISTDGGLGGTGGASSELDSGTEPNSGNDADDTTEEPTGCSCRVGTSQEKKLPLAELLLSLGALTLARRRREK